MPIDANDNDTRPEGETDRFFPVAHDMTEAAGVDLDWGLTRFGKDLSLTLCLKSHNIDSAGISALQRLALHARNNGHSLRIICQHRFTYTTLKLAGLCGVADLHLVGQPF
jgi:hypothetical protein